MQGADRPEFLLAQFALFLAEDVADLLLENIVAQAQRRPVEADLDPSLAQNVQGVGIDGVAGQFHPAQDGQHVESGEVADEIVVEIEQPQQFERAQRRQVADLVVVEVELGQAGEVGERTEVSDAVAGKDQYPQVAEVRQRRGVRDIVAREVELFEAVEAQ